MASAASSAAQRRKGSKRPPAQAVPEQVGNEGEAAVSSPKKLKITVEAANAKTDKDVEANSSSSNTKKGKEIQIKQEPVEGETNHNKENQNRQVTAFDWTAEELSTLITNLTACLPKNDTVKYSTLIEKLDWEKVRFGKYTAAECKEKWQQVMTKLRRYRTLTDMVTDAIEWLKHPWSSYHSTKKTQKHPEMPKKPLTPYFRYFLEKREKYSRENPDMSMTDLAKLLSKKFQDLPEKKRQKYKESYERENEVYRRKLELFKKEHPDQYPTPEQKQSQSTQGPEKPQTPFQLFANDKMLKAEFNQMEKKEAMEKIRQLWNGLSDGRRVKYVQKAVDDEQRYLMELEEYCQANPEYKPEALKPVLSKAEKELKDRIDGKPDRPPNSGYSLFSRILLRELTNFPSKEKMAEISKRWKMLPEAERENYNKQALKANQRYREKYALYLSKLPAHERKKLEELSRTAKKKVPNGNNAAVAAGAAGGAATSSNEIKKEGGEEGGEAKPTYKRPMSALQFYQQEKLIQARQKNPHLTRAELLKLMTREFAGLSERKKSKYEQMARAAKKTLTDTDGGGKRKLFKGEPKRPPLSGYSLFSSELLTKLKDFDPKDRMGEIAKRWKVMPNAEREKYNKRAQEQMKKYNKEFQKFLLSLSPEEVQEYERLRKRPGKAGKNDKLVAIQVPKAAQNKAGKQKDVKKEDSDSSSSEGSSDDDDDDDDEEEEDDEEGENDSQASSGDSDSGSGDSDSDSDSDESGDDSKKDGSKDGSSSEDSDSDSNSESNSDSSSDDGSDSDSESEEEE